MKKIKKPEKTLSIKVFYALVIMAEVIVVVASSSGILELLHSLFESTKRVPDVVWLVVISVVLGAVTILILMRLISAPIKHIDEAMKRVAEGDFDTRLDTVHGFSEIKKISKNFNLMTQELAATEILQTDFVSNVSHEFKTPINAIEGYATLLQNEDITDEEKKKYVDKILFNTKRLSALVGNILLLSKIDNQGIPSRNTTYRLDEQIRQSLLSLEPRWSERDTEFDVELDEIEYTGNESLLTHVWTNLIDNAIKFGPRGGLVRITLARDGEVTVFTLEDGGPGIDSEMQKHIFDKFYQVDSSHKSEGNGLGLALVKRIVTLEGGEISMENRAEGGARFTVRL